MSRLRKIATILSWKWNRSSVTGLRSLPGDVSVETVPYLPDDGSVKTPWRMYMLSKKLAAIAAVSLITASSAAVAQSAQPLSLSHSTAQRAGADAQDASELDRRGIGIYIVGAVALGLIIWGIIELTKNDNGPESP